MRSLVKLNTNIAIPYSRIDLVATTPIYLRCSQVDSCVVANQPLPRLRVYYYNVLMQSTKDAVLRQDGTQAHDMDSCPLILYKATVAMYMSNPLDTQFWTAEAFWLRAHVLLLGLALDWWLGEPARLWRRVPHPIVAIGHCIGFADRRFNRRDKLTAKQRGCAGVFVVAVLVALTWIVGVVIGVLAGALGGLIVLTVLLAAHSLNIHVRSVALALDDSILAARKSVGKIVGRDISAMSEGDIACAAVETTAENLSDAVIAPAFWFVVGGAPGILVYKMVNTADSMIGYRNATYLGFEWAAARLDDLLNIVPARLTGLLICVAALRWGYGELAFRTMWAEGKHHASPNSGRPEAAMAWAINVWLAGPRRCGNRVRHAQKFNASGRDADRQAIHASITVLV